MRRENSAFDQSKKGDEFVWTWRGACHAGIGRRVRDRTIRASVFRRRQRLQREQPDEKARSTFGNYGESAHAARCAASVSGTGLSWHLLQRGAVAALSRESEAWRGFARVGVPGRSVFFFGGEQCKTNERTRTIEKSDASEVNFASKARFSSTSNGAQDWHAICTEMSSRDILGPGRQCKHHTVNWEDNLNLAHSHIKLKDGVNDMTPVTFVK